MNKGDPMSEKPTTHPPAFWDSHIKKYRASGLSQQKYCEENGLNAKSLSNQIYFRSKAAKEKQPKPKEPTGFIRAVVEKTFETKEHSAPSRQAVARLTTSSGMVLEFDAGASPEWIGRLLKVVEKGI
jgi:hypothetical protein